MSTACIGSYLQWTCIVIFLFQEPSVKAQIVKLQTCDVKASHRIFRLCQIFANNGGNFNKSRRTDLN